MLREPEIYGHKTLDDVRALCEGHAQGLGLAVDFRQSNHEGELIDWIQQAQADHVGIILNPGGYTHTSVALMDALRGQTLPAIEVQSLQHPPARALPPALLRRAGRAGLDLRLRRARLSAGARRHARPAGRGTEAMAQKPPTAPRPDIELIRALAAVLDEAGLTEIEIGEGEGRIRIARKPAPAAVAAAAAVPAPQAAPRPAAAHEEEPPGAASADDASHPGAVISPLVGVVYVAPEPGGPPFVTVGDDIAEGETLFIVEAMKTMNPVRAPRAGRVTRILAENGARVEYGEVLLILE